MIYRTEHPKPQFRRDTWQNLNGEWQFEIDSGNSGVARNLHQTADDYSMKIQVPFCPESRLSGIENVDFMNSVWYKREFEITSEQLNGLIYLHFGAVDYEAEVYVNGTLCGKHRGGYVSFACDITEAVHCGNNTVVVHAIDDTRNRLVPCGKQCEKYHSETAFYTRTTGIWQTVWLEFVPKTHIQKVKYATDIHEGTVTITAMLCGDAQFSAEAFYEGQPMGSAQTISHGGTAMLTIHLAEKYLWSVGKGGLYDLVLRYGEDTVHSYFGLRSLRLDGYKFLINDAPVFQRLILDQGFYPDGLYTAPDDSELVADIQRSLAMGFNGARLHEKVFEERFLYHCDRLGYIVWGEYPNWGLDHSYADSIYSLLPEWLEEIDRDYNHPAIVGWCPFNETWDTVGGKQFDPLLSMVYKATKAADPGRPCIDTSGMFHVKTDIYDLHDYEQDPVQFAEHYAPLLRGERLTFHDAFEDRQHYDGKLPFFVSEYGGIGWTLDEQGWGYGNAPKTRDEFIERFRGLTDTLLDNPQMFGFCYTQLTDIEQEQNGLYTYDRIAKFPPEVIAPIVSRKAAIEE